MCPERASIHLMRGIVVIKCVLCGQEVTSKRGLVFHIKKHGINSFDEYIKDFPEQEYIIEPKDDSLLTCPICGRYNMKQLGQHITGTHKMTQKEFKVLYPNQIMFIPEISERCKRATEIGVQQYYKNKAENPEKYAEINKRKAQIRLQNNPDIGKKISEILKSHGVYDRMSGRVKEQWNDAEYREKQSEKCKRQHDSGLTEIIMAANRKRIPATIGDTEYTFRSSWEVKFAAMLYSLHIPFQYEAIRIPYVYKGKNKFYYPDFLITGTNIIFEVKPSALTGHSRNVAKQTASIESGFDFRYITENELNSPKTINFLNVK